MREVHPDDQTLIEVADGTASNEARDAVLGHLRVCPRCAERLRQFHALEAAFADEETWHALDQITGNDQLRKLTAYERRLAEEDIEAERIVRPLLSTPLRFDYSNIARKRRFHTGGVVRLLCREANTQCDREPLFALALADAATQIADALPDDYYHASEVNELRGSAWKDYATACRYLGRFAEAMEALDRAEQAFEHLMVPQPRLAMVALGRAIVLWKQERYHEALGQAGVAVQMYGNAGDERGAFDAMQVEAVILQRMGDTATACRAYERLFDLAETLDDAEMTGRAAQNLAAAYLERGDIGSSNKFYLLALQTYESLEMTARAARSRWGLGRVALVAGNFAEAARKLGLSSDELDALGMKTDVYLVKLDLAEALLMLGRFDEVVSVAETLQMLFREANMLTGALTAAAFLHEAAAARRLTRPQVQTVRRYLADLEREPTLAFARPPDE
jgi:tetratricopeptide (TPR) repeat protein